MDKNQLRNFIALSQTLNFSSVAKREFISQPALTKQISRLEEELGVTLFHRTKHGVSLTFAGKEFYKHAVDLITRMEDAQQHMEHISKGLVGTLAISSVPGMESLIASGVRRFTENYPNVAVSIFTGTGTQQIMTINEKSCDVFFSFTSLLTSFPNIETADLPEDRMAIYLHKNDAEKLESEGFSYLENLENLIESNSEGPFLTPQVLSIVNALGLRTDRYVYHPSNATILIAVQAGLGYSILPAQMNFGLLPEGIVRIPLDIPESVIHRSIGWHKNSNNIAAKHFIEIIRESTTL